MGAEKYELLVSTLNKLPTLKENLTSKSEELFLLEKRLGIKEREIDTLKGMIQGRDSRLEKIESQLEKLGLEIVKLNQNIKIEEKKVKPYTQRKEEAKRRVTTAKKSLWNESNIRSIVYCVLVFAFFMYLSWKMPRDSSDWGFRFCCLGFLVPCLLGLWMGLDGPSDSRRTKVVMEAKTKAWREWNEANSRCNGFWIKLGKAKAKWGRLAKEKDALGGLEKGLKKKNKQFDDLENSVSACSKEIEYLEKEIEDGHNAIAPLIPYSDLLLDDE